MKYIYGFIALAFSIAFLGSTDIGKSFFTVILVLILVLIIALIVNSNSIKDKSDRDRFKDSDKPYFSQKVSSSRDHGDPSSRWASWLGMLLVPIAFALILIFTD